jgi:hypothetical protein
VRLRRGYLDTSEFGDLSLPIRMKTTPGDVGKPSDPQIQPKSCNNWSRGGHQFLVVVPATTHSAGAKGGRSPQLGRSCAACVGDCVGEWDV